MKKILYILNDCMRRFSYERTASLYQAVQRMEEPASLYIIRTDGHSAFAPEHNRGEYNILRLPNYADFDGIILDINSIFNTDSDSFNECVLCAVQSAASSGKPVVSMANDIGDFYYVGIDNYAAMQSVIDHLHRERGLNDFAFVMGPADNFEVQVRARALMEYCADNHLPCDDDRFYYGSFTVECGLSALEQLIGRRGGRLPQAVICANDRIAMGICHAAELAGYNIPRDFMVAGFDNDDVSAYLTPSITSVDQLCWNMGGVCVDTLCRLWRGESLPKRIYTPTELILRESTGHTASAQFSQKWQIVDTINQTASVASFNYRLSALQYQLPGCQSIEEICLALVKCLSAMKLKGVRLILDSALFDFGRIIRFHHQGDSVQDTAEGMPTTGYSDTMEVVFSWQAGADPQFTRQRVSSSLSTSQYTGPRENYLFAPLHFMEYTVGYLCIWDCLDLMGIRGISAIVNALSVALRNFVTQRNLSYINQVLSGMSMKDDLTGLYNRLGYHDLAYPLFREICESGGRLGILFIDMDRLKTMNDTYGHALGDRAIQSVANAIRRSIPQDAIPIRYGGDEFLIIVPVESEAQIPRLLDAVSSALPGEAKALGVPGGFGISSGYILTEPNPDKSLDEYVREADERMYREKRAKRSQRSEK